MSEELEKTEEVESNILYDLIGDNIVIVIHQDGVSVMMNDEEEDRSDEQMKCFSRVYAALNPSFILRLFLIIEVFMLVLYEQLEEKYKKFFNKD